MFACSTQIQKHLDHKSISELSPKGEGKARSKGFVIYVVDIKPGARAKIKIMRITEKQETDKYHQIRAWIYLKKGQVMLSLCFRQD